MRFAYADPPYPGNSRKYYQGEEVDHAGLVSRLTSYDGWALSTSSRALRDVLLSCPPGVRVGVWVCGARKGKSSLPYRAWEPVIFAGGRRLEPVVQDLSDVLLWGGRQRSHPGALVGMKPAAFCEWVFRMLGAARGDTLDDLYPGSGAVGRAWRLFQGRRSAPASTLPSRLQEAQRVVAAGQGDGSPADLKPHKEE